MSKKLLLFVCVAFLAVATTGGAFAASSGDEPVKHARGSHVASVSVRRVVNRVDARVVKRLRIFRAARVAGRSSVLPAEIQAIIATQLAPRNGANWRLAKTVETPSGPLYIVPGQDSICQLGAAGTGCGDVSRLGADPRAYALFGYSRGVNPSGTITASGIATDDVRSISAVVPTGAPIEIPIVDNAYSSFIPANTTELVYETADGKTVSADVRGIGAPPSGEKTVTPVG